MLAADAAWWMLAADAAWWMLAAWMLAAGEEGEETNRSGSAPFFFGTDVRSFE